MVSWTYRKTILWMFFLGLIISSCGREEKKSFRGSPAAKSGDNPAKAEEQMPVASNVETKAKAEDLLKMVETKRDLPECDQSSIGMMSYVRSEGKFFDCYQGGWEEVHLAVQNNVPAVVNGTDGYSTLLKIINEAPGNNCRLGGKKLIEGLDNGKGGGVAGNGVLEDGEVSYADYICREGIGIFDGDDQFVGFSLGILDNNTFMTIIFANNGFARFNMTNGKYSGGIGYIKDGEIREMNCLFFSSDCSGTCYTGDKEVETFDSIPLENSIFFTGNEFYIANGKESDAGAQTFSSKYSTSCIAGAEQRSHAYPITQSYTLPDSRNLPIKTPLYFKRSE
ncbi:MAG: hypothetical protein HQK54_09275 [Oligoflexales bacterium]|nr:hypothetical protein [Oligoflexales bacterium]